MIGLPCNTHVDDNKIKFSEKWTCDGGFWIKGMQLLNHVRWEQAYVINWTNRELVTDVEIWTDVVAASTPISGSFPLRHGVWRQALWTFTYCPAVWAVTVVPSSGVTREQCAYPCSGRVCDGCVRPPSHILFLFLFKFGSACYWLPTKLSIINYAVLSHFLCAWQFSFVEQADSLKHPQGESRLDC
jgi:hypothetical protein